MRVIRTKRIIFRNKILLITFQPCFHQFGNDFVNNDWHQRSKFSTKIHADFIFFRQPGVKILFFMYICRYEKNRFMRDCPILHIGCPCPIFWRTMRRHMLACTWHRLEPLPRRGVLGNSRWKHQEHIRLPQSHWRRWQNRPYLPNQHRVGASLWPESGFVPLFQT